jgi:pimeloyl-ACP methyl ester carboxylesterase
MQSNNLTNNYLNEENRHQSFEERMEVVELPMMRLAGMPEGAIERHWATFPFDGQEFRARYFTFGDESKPTLLMTLGHGAAVLQAVLTFKGLAENFRVIAFDSFSFGANTRMDYCSGLESAERAEECMLEWYTEFIRAIEHSLPQKFYMFAMCSGCYPMGLYAAANQERIEKLFFGSPAGIQRGTAPSLYEHRNVSHADILPSKQEVD